MARTAGAVSNVAISLGNLFRVLGLECPEIAKHRKIVISAKWLSQQNNPADFVTITREQLNELKSGNAVLPADPTGMPANFAPAPPPREGAEELDISALLGEV